MIITVSNTITVTSPLDTFKQWCDDFLTIDNPEYAKKIRMGLWLGNTPKQLKLYIIRGDDLVLPYGVIDYIPAKYWLISNVSYEHLTHEIDFNNTKDICLYSYQSLAVEALLKHGFGILQAPAGSGKTQMGIALIKEFSQRTLWLTHTLDLLKQSKDRAAQYLDENTFGVISGGKVNIGTHVTFATVQTMAGLDLTQLKDHWSVIIVDECHRCAGSPTQMTRYYKVLNNLNAKHKIGLSATVHRADGLIKATHMLLGKIAYEVADEDVEDNIMTVNIMPVYTHTGLSYEFLNTDGTLNYAKMINGLCSDFERNKTIVDTLKAQKGNSCLILTSRLSHIDTLIDMLPADISKDAVKISGTMTSKTGKAYREKVIDQMRSGEKKYLFATYALAKEGLDIPRLNRLILSTPQKDYAIITQSIGRIARTSEGKTDSICYDFIDNFPFALKAYKERCRTYRKNRCNL